MARGTRGKMNELPENTAFLDTEPTQDEQDLQTFLDDVGPSMASVDLYKLHRDGRKAYKDRMFFADLKDNAMAHIRVRYGPGKWLLTFRDAGGRIKGNKTVDIDPEDDEPPTPTPAAAANPVPAPESQHLTFMREQMQMQQNLLLALITNMGKGPAAPDMGAMLSGFAAMLAAMKPSQPNEIPWDKVLAVMKPNDPTGQIVSLITALKPNDTGLDLAAKVIGMARDLAPEKGGSSEGADSLWGAVSDVGKHVADTFLRPVVSTVGQVATPVVEQRQLPIVQDTKQTTPETPNPNGNESMIRWIKAGIEYLKNKAQMSKDPDAYIEQILENQEEPQWQALLYAIRQGATFDSLLTFDPSIAENPAVKDWFKAVFDGLLAELNDNHNPTGGAGDAADVAGNETDGAGRQPATPDSGPSKPVGKSEKH